jgi:hypothetical protein
LQTALVAQILIGEQLVELALAVFGAAAFEMAFSLLMTTQFAIGGKFEPFGCAFIGLDFGHFITPDK